MHYLGIRTGTRPCGKKSSIQAYNALKNLSVFRMDRLSDLLHDCVSILLDWIVIYFLLLQELALALSRPGPELGSVKWRLKAMTARDPEAIQERFRDEDRKKREKRQPNDAHFDLFVPSKTFFRKTRSVGYNNAKLAYKPVS